MRLLRDAGYDRPIYIHGALARLSEYYQSQGIDLGRLETGNGRERAARATSPAPSSSARHRPSPTAGRGASPTRSSCFASGWMRIRQRAKQGGVELPLIISDHSDWDELTAHDRGDRRAEKSG